MKVKIEYDSNNPGGERIEIDGERVQITELDLRMAIDEFPSLRVTYGAKFPKKARKISFQGEMESVGKA